nr:hypothetical protein [Burkholderia pseudomallei]
MVRADARNPAAPRSRHAAARDTRIAARNMRRRVATSRHRERDDAKITAQPMFRSAMSIAFHSRSLSLPVALAACSRMAGLNLKKRLPD